MANIYKLSVDLQKLYDNLIASADENGEVDETIAESLAVAEKDFETKAVGYGVVIRKFDTDITEIEAEISRLTAMRDGIVRTRNRMEDCLLDRLLSLGYESIDRIEAKVKIKTTERTIVGSVDELPDEFVSTKVEVKKTADKKKIKEALKRGEEVRGCYIEQHKELQIK